MVLFRDARSEDLTKEQRPDLRPPIFNVKVHVPAAISSGYWFVAPYANLDQAVKSDHYEPYQVGPHIYDQSGVRNYSP
jgi:hypothetical protein